LCRGRPSRRIAKRFGDGTSGQGRRQWAEPAGALREYRPHCGHRQSAKAGADRAPAGSTRAIRSSSVSARFDPRPPARYVSVGSRPTPLVP
jgi:hypothetical protein